MSPLRDHLRRALAVGVVGLLLGAGAVLLVVRSAGDVCCHDTYTSTFNRHVTGVDAVLGEGDGQAFAVLARDPTLARPHVFLGENEAAYRAQRPLLVYLTWAGSLGSPDRVAWTIAVLEMIGCGFAAGALALLLQSRNANPWFGLAVVPFGMAALQGLTPEILGLGLAVAGIVAWERDARGWAVIWLTGAALTRESMLLVPAVLAVEVLVRARNDDRVRRELRAALVALAMPFVVFASWLAVLRLRLGAFPTAASHRRLGLPLQGLLTEVGHWDATNVAWFALAAVLLALALAVAPRDRLTWIAFAYGAFALFMGPDVWLTSDGFTRVLLPLYVLAASASFAALSRRTATERASGPAVTSSSAWSWSAAESSAEPSGAAAGRA
jgi:hypothetical protein